MTEQDFKVIAKEAAKEAIKEFENSGDACKRCSLNHVEHHDQHVMMTDFFANLHLAINTVQSTVIRIVIGFLTVAMAGGIIFYAYKFWQNIKIPIGG